MEGTRVAILGYGSIVQNCVEAAEMLKSRDIAITVADARFCKPLDTELIRRLAKEHEYLITIEEGSIGGFGSHVCQFLSLSGLLDGPLKVMCFRAAFVLTQGCFYKSRSSNTFCVWFSAVSFDGIT